MRTLTSHTGYLVVDHSNSPGVPKAITDRLGLPPMPEGSVVERDTLRCGHCPQVWFKNPLRQRDRGHCRKCNAYLCDICEARRVAHGGECREWDAVIDRLHEQALKHARQPETAAPSLVLTDAGV